MAGVILSVSDRAHFLQMMRRQGNSAVHRRMNALLLLDEGWSAEQVAKALFIDAETVHAHRRLYGLSGRVGIETLSYTGHAAVLSAAERDVLTAELDSRLFLTAKEVCGFVAERLGWHYTPHAMAKLLCRLGYVWKRPKRVPAKADPIAQKAFVETTLSPLMARAAVDPGQPLYFVDATPPAYDAHPACGWMRRGQTRVLNCFHGRANVTLNGALAWPTREMVVRQAKRITGEEMVAMLRELAARHPRAEEIAVVLDNATYNRAATVREFVNTSSPRIRLVYLPSYAPNLNLIERLWLHFKKKTLWNRHYPRFAQFQDAVLGFFRSFNPKEPDIVSLITEKFHFLGQPPTQIPSA